MTVSTAPAPLRYNGNGSTTAFPITWKYNAKSHVVATLRSSAGAETVWVLDTNYTLTAPGDSGTLTATVAPATGETLVITLEPPNTQSSSLPLGGAFPSTTVEDGFDLTAQRDAKIETLFNRALRVPKTDTKSGSDLQIPIDSVRASKFLAFDASGNPIASVGTSDNLGPVTAFANTLLDDVDAATARATLGVPNAVETLTNKTLTSPVINTPTGDVATLTGTQTLTNKTLTSPVINTPTGDVATITGTQTLTNKTLTTPAINSATGIGQSIVKRKTADESVTSSTTVQDDDHLLFAIGASEEWVADIYLHLGAALATTGFKLAITGPSGVTLQVGSVCVSVNLGQAHKSFQQTTNGGTHSFTAAFFTNSTSDEAVLHIHLWALNSVTAGDIKLQWAQATSSATAVTVRKGSHLIAHRIA